MTEPLFIIDDQAHYLASDVRVSSPRYDKVLATLKATTPTFDAFDGDGFLNQFFTQTATHLACLNIVGLGEVCGVNMYQAMDAHAKTRDKAPDRVILFGSVNPLEGEKAVSEMDRQYHELGARGFKFYPNDPEGGPSGWWCDDPKLAYPIWEKSLELGINFASVHKLPLPFLASKWQDPEDISDAALSFPEMNFVVYHMGYPAIEKTASICASRPNVYVDIGLPLMSALVHKPEWFSHIMCKFLADAPVERICWGTDLMLYEGGQDQIEAFWNWQVPESYQKGYGISPLTVDDKKRIFGGNFARFLGINPSEHLKRIKDDVYSRNQAPRVREFLKRTS